MVKLFSRKKQGHPQAGFGTGEWEWWEKEDTHIFRRALSLGSTSTGEYNGGWLDGKPHGQGVLEIRPGHRYEGAWKSGRPDGHGKCNYPDGTVYEGEFSNGVPHGKGSRTWADGSTEVGEFAEGKVHGKGKTVNDEGDIFEGNFSDCIPNGQGEFKFADGDWFLGIVQNGLPLDGQCKQSVETDGQFGDAFFEYEGAVSAGVWNGQGRLTLYDKRSKLATRKREEQYKLYTYEGEFKNGKFHGKGKKVQIRDSDGGEGFHPGIGSWEYEGEWRNDDMSGQGKLTYTRSGSVYQGSFKSGKPHGQGTFKGGDGQYKEGTWSHGQFREGKIKMRWEDGRVYEGGMVDAEMEGHGTMEWPNGDKLEGNFEKGLFPEYALLVTGKGVKRNVVLEEGFLQNLTGSFPPPRPHPPNASLSMTAGLIAYQADERTWACSPAM